MTSENEWTLLVCLSFLGPRHAPASWKECCDAFLCYEAQIPFLSESSKILVVQDGTKLALRLRKKHEGLNIAGSIGR